MSGKELMPQDVEVLRSKRGAGPAGDGVTEEGKRRCDVTSESRGMAREIHFGSREIQFGSRVRSPYSESVLSQLVAKAGAVEQQVFEIINLSTRSKQSDYGRFFSRPRDWFLLELCSEMAV